jgi:microcystin degradation protein MlrC
VSKRVVVASLFHETNTFLRGKATAADFEEKRGEELLGVEGDASPLAGALEVAHGSTWEVVPAVDLRAMPGPMVADEVVERFWELFRSAAEGASPRGVDGVFLVLHGAMVSESLPDVEGEVLRRMRSLSFLDRVPICGVLDLHANFSEQMAHEADALLCYRENPHTDAKEAARRAALLLDRFMETGERPKTVRVRPPLLWPPGATGTAEEPMRRLEEEAREIERRLPQVLAANVYGGFAFSDVPEAGVAFSAVTVGDAEHAQAELQKLAKLAWSQRAEGARHALSLEGAMRRLAGHTEGPVVLTEPADNVGGGAPGDGTHLLHAFVEHGVENSGVVVNDPEAVVALRGVPLGGYKRLSLGGKSGEIGSHPLDLEVELLSRGDGRFRLEDPKSHLASVTGEIVDMGPCALVSHRGVKILLTSRKTPPFDLGQWRSQGVSPERLFAMGVKASVGHRGAYDPIARATYAVDVPGPCAENLDRLPYRRLLRPVYPLDPDASFGNGSLKTST